MFANVENNEFKDSAPGEFVITEVCYFAPDYEITRYEHTGTAQSRATAFAKAVLDANHRSEESITGGYGYAYNVTEETKH